MSTAILILYILNIVYPAQSHFVKVLDSHFASYFECLDRKGTYSQYALLIDSLYKAPYYAYILYTCYSGVAVIVLAQIDSKSDHL